MAAGRLHTPKTSSSGQLLTAMLLGSLLSMLPDADVLGFSFGIRYADPWGHRGASHSLALALMVGVVLGAGLTALQNKATRSLPRTVSLCVLVIASHGLLDTLTTGGLGCSLGWPWTDTRYFAPFRPIPVAPLGVGFLSGRGAEVALTELVLFCPFWLYALWPRRRSRSREIEK
jgi:inner membrane protein